MDWRREPKRHFGSQKGLMGDFRPGGTDSWTLRIEIPRPRITSVVDEMGGMLETVPTPKASPEK